MCVQGLFILGTFYWSCDQRYMYIIIMFVWKISCLLYKEGLKTMWYFWLKKGASHVGFFFALSDEILFLVYSLEWNYSSKIFPLFFPAIFSE